MSLAVRKSEFFLTDFDAQFQWYEQEPGFEVAHRYLSAIDETLRKLARFPDLGRSMHFEHPDLHGLRSFPVAKPFSRHLIFYRHDGTSLDAVRVMHSAWDLPRRLHQPPGTEDDETP